MAQVSKQHKPQNVKKTFFGWNFFWASRRLQTESNSFN